MGTLELSIIVSLIFTVGHYLTWWVAYLEKRFEMDEVLDPIRKRMQKKKAKGKGTMVSHRHAHTHTHTHTHTHKHTHALDLGAKTPFHTKT